MNIIRDEEMCGIMMIPLFQQYGIKRCNVRDCKEKHTTIITGLTDNSFALCEKHYQESKASGKINYTLDF
jgi:predicted branched-subunit amino acid permease